MYGQLEYLVDHDEVWYDVQWWLTVGPSRQEAIRCQGTLYVRSRASTIDIAGGGTEERISSEWKD